MNTVRVRFAPSPTGFLHIGGVRTALFNWLFARRHHGKFILRIDDTDVERNLQATLTPILHGLSWLRIDWDEGPGTGGVHGPYFQSQRQSYYENAVAELLRSGHAYYDYATLAEMATERKAARGAFQYSRRWMAVTMEQRRHFEAEGRKPVVRLKMPREGAVVIHDLVRGDVVFEWAQEQDHVIQRSDGSFLYSLASVVDDFAFDITHVIRAEEHLSNTPRQIFIAQALGYRIPAFAHLPHVAEPGSKKKLSKRELARYLEMPEFVGVHKQGLAIAEAMGLTPDPEIFNPVVVDFYERTGFLPQAIVNYLALLGWSLDDKTEFFTPVELTSAFSLDRVSAAPASFDPAKLMAVQMRHMRELSLQDKVAGVVPFLARAGFIGPLPSKAELQWITEIVTLLGERLKVFGDIVLQGQFFFDVPLTYDESAFAKWVLSPDAAERLASYGEWLRDRAEFDSESLERDTRTYLADRGLKLKDLVHTARVAVTGVATGPGLFESMALIGRERCVARIEAALQKVESRP